MRGFARATAYPWCGALRKLVQYLLVFVTVYRGFRLRRVYFRGMLLFETELSGLR